MISFIVPAHDEERLIAATLDAIRSSASAMGGRFEVIVVDDASSDQTANIATEHGARVIHVSHRQIAATRNAGAAEARGEWLFFIDADTLINPDYLAAALAAMRRGAVGGGAGVKLLGKAALHERVGQVMLIHIFRWVGVTPGCSLFCTRAAFDTVGGFDETYYAGEDVAMGRALARHGRLVILKEVVMTSARKLRTHTLGEQLRLLARFLWRGRKMLRSRHELGMWYGKRRDEP
ncbi:MULTISPECIES: glycosyltransferase [unclassified Lysobacter]